jgi:trehalose synthase
MLYEAVNRAEAQQFAADLRADDILIVHDPQPLALAAFLDGANVYKVWRCHIGVDEDTPHTRTAWDFLRPYIQNYDHTIFSVADYVPQFLRDRASIIHPSIDPLSHKNRDLSLHKLVGILSDADLVVPHWPLVAPPFAERARRLRTDGSLAPATTPADIGLLARPILAQISRWDRLKGFGPLLAAFAELKQNLSAHAQRDGTHARRLAAARLVLAGPDPSGINDDPEAREVLHALAAQYQALPADVQADVAIVTLPLSSRKENALMVNALQRAADIVVQNSLREGFGLTVSEAMWKRTCVLGSGRACGVRLQVRDGVEGRLVSNPEDSGALAQIMAEMLSDSDRVEEWGRNAQRRVYTEFLIFAELRKWLRVLADLPSRTRRS